MDQIGTFINIKNREFHFSNCNNCQAKCCNGKENFIMSPIYITDMSSVYKNFKILFGFLENKNPIMVIVLNDGENYCKYINEKKECSIYDQRPPTCIQYPISSYNNEIFIDSDCPAISTNPYDILIAKNNQINKNFFSNRLENSQIKYEKTQQFLNSILTNKNIKLHANIKGIDLYEYIGLNSNEYINYHKDSLVLNT